MEQNDQKRDIKNLIKTIHNQIDYENGILPKMRQKLQEKMNIDHLLDDDSKFKDLNINIQQVLLKSLKIIFKFENTESFGLMQMLKNIFEEDKKNKEFFFLNEDFGIHKVIDKDGLNYLEFEYQECSNCKIIHWRQISVANSKCYFCFSKNQTFNDSDEKDFYINHDKSKHLRVFTPMTCTIIYENKIENVFAFRLILLLRDSVLLMLYFFYEEKMKKLFPKKIKIISYLQKHINSHFEFMKRVLNKNKILVDEIEKIWDAIPNIVSENEFISFKTSGHTFFDKLSKIVKDELSSVIATNPKSENQSQEQFSNSCLKSIKLDSHFLKSTLKQIKQKDFRDLKEYFILNNPKTSFIKFYIQNEEFLDYEMKEIAQNILHFVYFMKKKLENKFNKTQIDSLKLVEVLRENFGTELFKDKKKSKSIYKEYLKREEENDFERMKEFYNENEFEIEMKKFEETLKMISNSEVKSIFDSFRKKKIKDLMLKDIIVNFNFEKESFVMQILTQIANFHNRIIENFAQTKRNIKSSIYEQDCWKKLISQKLDSSQERNEHLSESKKSFLQNKFEQISFSNKKEIGEIIKLVEEEMISNFIGKKTKISLNIKFGTEFKMKEQNPSIDRKLKKVESIYGSTEIETDQKERIAKIMRENSKDNNIFLFEYMKKLLFFMVNLEQTEENQTIKELIEENKNLQCSHNQHLIKKIENIKLSQVVLLFELIELGAFQDIFDLRMGMFGAEFYEEEQKQCEDFVDSFKDKETCLLFKNLLQIILLRSYEFENVEDLSMQDVSVNLKNVIDSFIDRNQNLKTYFEKFVDLNFSMECMKEVYEVFENKQEE